MKNFVKVLKLLVVEVLTLGVFVAERRRSHVAEPDGSLAAAVDEGVALVRVKLRRRDHLRQLLHVGRFDVDDVWRRPGQGG